MVDVTANGAVPVAIVEVSCPLTTSEVTFARSSCAEMPVAVVLIVLSNAVTPILVTPVDPAALVNTSGVTTKLTDDDGVKPTPLTRYFVLSDV